MDTLPLTDNTKTQELSAIYDAISRVQAVIEFSLDGTILAANDNFLSLMEYDLAEVQGQHHSIFVDPAYKESLEYKGFWSRLSQGQFQQAEFKRITKTGKEVWILASYNPLFDEYGKPYKVVKFASDITAQKLQNADYSGQIEAIGKSQAVIEFNMDGTIIQANDNFLNAMGYSLSEVQGQHHRMFAEPGYANSSEYKAFWDSLNRGEFFTGEYKRLGKGGREVWIQASYNPIMDLNGKPFKVVKYASDITAQKLQNADYSGQIEAIGKSQAVIEFNMDGTIIQANDNFLNAMGYSLNEVQGKHHSMFAEPVYANSSEYKAFWETLNRGEFFSDEYKRIGKGGKEVWIQASYNPIMDLNGKPFKVVKYASDITEQKLQNADYSGQIEAIGKSQAVIEFNMDGTIIQANDNFLNAMGYSLNEVQGKHHGMFAEPGYANSPAYKSFWDSLNRGEFFTGEYKRIGKGGKEVWIQASYNPIMDLNGKPFKVVKYATDITEQKLQSADYSGQIEAIGKSQAVIEFNMDGTIIEANDNFLNTMGYSLNEIQGKHHRMFAEPTYANSSEYKSFWDALNRGEFFSDEYKRIGKGGKEVWIQASYNPIMDLNGKPFKVVKYAVDITARKFAISQISQTLLALSEGDLSHVIEEELEGEFNELKDAMNSTLDRLYELIGSINTSAQEVSYSAGEIQSGTSDLSQRTEEQASSLEETASSIEQLSSAVSQNAQNASKANNLSSDTTQKAEEGGQVVNNAINAMSEIDTSSKKIADIIGVIDEIAFQTNLLALNAAVEAARAGDQGRGFAVVAGEVRNLAQRSAGAAKEIKALIKESVTKVEEGTKLVNQSGETLADIVSSIRQVNDLIAEINVASQEQSSGINQVSKAVSSMDEITQQNASLVQESSTMSENMSDEAQKLIELIQFFNSDEEDY